MNDQRDLEQKLLELIREVVTYDEELRNKYQIGNKFRFVQDKLHVLLTQFEQSIEQKQTVKKDSTFQMAADEVIIYVYLYNTYGTNIKSWQNMLSPKVFYEYSVNRPIYAEKKDIEMLLRSKSEKLQHAYLAIAVKQKDVIAHLSESSLLKVKEGALRFERVVTFTHNQLDYVINSQGELVKKEL